MELSASPKFGEMLVMQRLLTRAQVEQALKQASGRIGDFLCAHGLIHGREAAQVVAAQQRIEAVDLAAMPPEPHLYCPRDLPLYIAHRFMPYRHRGGALTLATPEPSEELRAFAQAHYRTRITFVVVTNRDLASYFATRGSETSSRRAQLHLRRAHRHLVADRILLSHQLRGLGVLLAALTVLAVLAPLGLWQALIVICNFFYAATLVIKFEFYRQGVAAHQERAALEATLVEYVAAMDDASLPTYSILVPMYRESGEVMARLIAHLEALDYPKEKLDIKLICEADDRPTLKALKALQPPQRMEIIVVPPSLPRTKPKACNVALPHVRGEFTVIYDAEDAPAPDQLKRAVAMFRRGPERLACLQAALNYYNREENLLTQMFAIEYSALFRLLLPGLERMGLPIPLGGTSNHLRTEALREVGGWDAFNVTEDADLGIRLHYFGYETRTLPSLTLEESPITLGAWMKQRTRWIKGYIQTWLVFTRDAAELKRRLGSTGYYGFQFFVGAPALTFLLAPLFWVIFFVSLTDLFPLHLSPAMLGLCAFSFVGGIVSHWLFARQVMLVEGWQGMRGALLLYPFYWLLHSIAAARALWQLVTAPHYWDKTRHGVSRTLAAG